MPFVRKLARVLRDLASHHVLLAGTLATAMLSTVPASAVEIEYWQYVFDSRIAAINQLIAKFEAANPDIKVKHTTFPYADYQTKITASMSAGLGPDVVQLYYGWLDKFVAAKFLKPLSREAFPPDAIARDFFPIIEAMKKDGEYYGLPTAVRTLALFYNKKLFTQAGIDAATPPQTLDELVGVASKIAKRDAGGNLLIEGIALDMAGQDHQWWREVLMRQFGGQAYSQDNSKVAYNDEAGVKALGYYVDLQRKHDVGRLGFMDEGQAAFRAGRAAMVVDGTFRLGAFGAIKGFEWGVAELPKSADGKRANYASYWINAITTNAKGEKAAAAEKFLAYLTSPEAMELWLKTVGELPARRAVALTPERLADPIYGPFLRGLDYSYTTRFVDEAAQRQIAIDMVNRVLIQNQDVRAALDEAAKAEQSLIDRSTGAR
ncbi:carbohydrate ABC transporter substrate-binding protein, CUT1 family [Rhizobiales bacterium GAS191]|nr:carbohydrate ABC transporter substrate-binding protein, CUT1 family [Rhizobiales bacterium GAS113]SEE57662.1 carbohydrate ABC transporter substrate-binding protein, CUT1 family [Rhizobiales bacterium GAS191]